MAVVTKAVMGARIARRKVLVVDDNPDVTACLSDLLGLLGHEPHEANTGARAVELAMLHGPDLVLLDLGLPDVDGYVVERALRSLPGGRAMQIVALSGRRLDPTRCGSFDRHVLKPIDLVQLRGILSSVG